MASTPWGETGFAPIIPVQKPISGATVAQQKAPERPSARGWTAFSHRYAHFGVLHPRAAVILGRVDRAPEAPLSRRLGLTSPAIANHNGVVVSTKPMPEEDEPPFGPATEGARGHGVRLLAWAVGCLLAVIGTVLTIEESLHHHHPVGPYFLAAGFFLFFLAALDMWRVERIRARRATRTIRRLGAQVERLEGNRQHLEQDRDQWRRMHAEEASSNRRLTEELQRVLRPHVSASAEGPASANPPTPAIDVGGEDSTPPTSPPVQRSRPRHQARRPADNQPRLFDQDDEHPS